MAEQKELKGIVRLVDSDTDGNTPVKHALSRGKGVSFMMANAICTVLKLDPKKKAGYLTADEIKKIEECARNPAKHNIPNWLFNRRKDLETGEDKHLVSADLTLRKTFDIRQLRKIKTYKGVRHSLGSKKVRGQRTKTTGRRSGALGVKRKKTSGKK
jgi:small subunit ribosomal protein S13